MQKPAAWSFLTPQARQRLYALLPPPKEGEQPYDIDEHPLECRLREWIEAALLRWQDDLGEGYELKTFREHKIETTSEDMPLESSSEEGSDNETAGSLNKH